MMLGVANGYERLAQRAEERAARLIPLKYKVGRSSGDETGEGKPVAHHCHGGLHEPPAHEQDRRGLLVEAPLCREPLF
jgi:hypothetical protein